MTFALTLNWKKLALATLLASGMSVAFVSSSSFADDDLSPRVIDGKLVIGYHNDAFSDISPLDGLDDTDGQPQNGVPAAPVFGYDLSLNYDLTPGNADDHFYFTEDPGVNSLAAPPGAAPLPGNTTLSSNFVSFTVAGNSTAANLFYWDGITTDGSGDPVFIPAIGTTLTLLRLNSQTVDGANAAVNGLIWGNSSANGTMHVHAHTTIDDIANPAMLPDPAAGVYLAGLEFTMPGLETSDPVWLAYGAGIDESVHDQALVWLSGNLPQAVPEPAGCAFAGVAGFIAFLAWRRK